MLAAAAPEACPFFSDEAFAAVMPGVKPKYNAKEYEQLTATLRGKVAELSGSGGAGGAGSGEACIGPLRSAIVYPCQLHAAAAVLHARVNPNDTVQTHGDHVQSARRSSGCATR